ncbi:hypothetical protein ACU12_05890 [Xanthomonas oryzae pv. oryzicola]|nr:hypothetical protein ACU12_05890 [Xanthomonas oryzae pv. oryzicola]
MPRRCTIWHRHAKWYGSGVLEHAPAQRVARDGDGRVVVDRHLDHLVAQVVAVLHRVPDVPPEFE